MAGEQMRSSFGTTAAQGCMKMLLMIFNFVFWVTGVALLVLGIWMKVQLYVYFQITTAHYSPTVAYSLIGIGSAIVVVGMMGCYCTVKGNSILLYMYAGFLVLVFVAELAAGIAGFGYKNKMEENMKTGLTSAINEKYGTDDEITKAVDSIQATLSCCGVAEYSDWFDTPWESAQTETSVVPRSCCRHDAAACQRDNLPPKPSQNQTMTIYTKGCYKLVMSFISTNFLIMGGTVIGLAFFMLVGALISCSLAKNINKSKYEQVA